METSEQQSEDNIQQDDLSVLPDGATGWGKSLLAVVGIIISVGFAANSGFEGYHSGLFAYFALALFGVLLARKPPNTVRIFSGFVAVGGGSWVAAVVNESSGFADIFPNAVLAFSLAYIAELVIDISEVGIRKIWG